MKRKLTMLLALVLIVAMFSTTALAGNSWLFYNHEYSWDNGYLVSKATEYWYGDDTASDEAKEVTVYEFTYNEYGYQTMETVTTTDTATKEVMKEITRFYYDEEFNNTKTTYHVVQPGSTEEVAYGTSVYEYDEQGREVKYISYEGSEKDRITYLTVTEYYMDSWSRAKETVYHGAEKEENLESIETYKYNDDEQRIERTRVEYSEGTPVTTTTTYKYDNAGNMVEETTGDQVITYEFNAQGVHVKTTYKTAGVVDEVDTYEYDENYNCVKEICTYGDGSADKYEYTFNDRNQMLTHTYNDELFEKNSYYVNGKIKVRDYVYWGETYAYNYDSNGNNTQLTLTRKDAETGKSFVSAKVDIEYEADPGACWFGDVEVGSWYYAPVVWASYNEVTTGTGDNTFSPNDECTRAQVVTFLYRAAGYPEISDTECSFPDVEEGTWYTDAVLWAAENGITTGKGDGSFDPNGIVTRAEFVTFLSRAANAKEATGKNNFSDVAEGAWYYDAVLWAAENGITAGKGSADTFAPTDTCSRAETVTFLFRYFG